MRKLLYTLIFILYTCSYAAAYPHLNFQNLNMSQGISDNYVRSISQDSWGMMWFITLNGIDSYDGYRSRHYNINNDPHWGDALYTIAEAGDSTLWVTGANDIYCYDRRSDIFTNDIMPVLKHYGVTTKPQKLFVDKDHCLWMQCGKNLLYYDMGRKHLTTIPLPRDYAILSLMCRHGKARILMTGPSLTPGRGSEVWKVDIAQHKVSFLSYTGYPAKTFATLYLDTTGRLWYYDTHETHLCWYNETTRGWVSMPEFSPAMGRMVTFVMDDGDGNLWVGTDNNGIFVYDYREQSVTQLQRGINDTPIVYDSGAERSYLVDEHIVCFYKDDKSSTMWVGTSKLGAVFASLNQMPISLIPMRVYGGTHSADVSVIYQQPWNKESLLLGFDGQGIGMGNIENIGSFAHYTTANSQMPSNQILCTFTDSKGRQWWGSYAGELFYRQGTGFTSIHNEALKSVYSIKEDRRGTLWFGTWANGVFALESNGKLTNYSIQNTVFKTDNITDLAYDGNRTLYVATSNGLYTMDIMTRKTATILSDHVKVLYLDRKTRQLWIGLRTGLISRNIKTGKSTTLTIANGLSHNYILGITQDHYGNIWVSTKNGVSVVTPLPTNGSGWVCTPFYAYDGLGKTTFNVHAITCASNGDILVGGIGYIVRITPRRTYDIGLSQYPVRFTGLSINGEDIQVGKEDSDRDLILGQNLQYTSTLTLHTWDRNVCIEVSAMNYANQHKIRYMYRLHDNEKWIPIESNVIQFNSLSAGRYLLQVKVAEPDGQNRNPVTTMHLEVLAPWYASSLAYILYFCLVIGGIAYYIYYLKKKHLAEEKAEKERLQIAHEQDMNDAKMRFFTNVSHDLRTPLSLILTPLERMLSRDNLTADTRRQLELMQRSAETLKNDVTQLLDFRKLDESLEVLNAKECSLRALTEHECQKIDDSNLPNGIHLQVSLSDDPLFATVDERKMKRILNNLLSNAIKYNTPNGQIVVETFRDNDSAVLRVTDTGIGIKDSDRKNIFDRFYQGKHDETTYVGSGIGLYIIKQYVNLHHGTISVMKNEPQGSVFEVRIPTSPNPSQGGELTNTDGSLKNVSTEKTNKISSPREGMGEVILVVEDNDDFRSFLVSCLCDQYTVLEAANGQEALNILNSQLSAQDSKLLIISDVMMPVMDGMELLKRVKSDISLSHIPFIMLTARTAEEQQAAGLRDGADDYITKPFNLDILLLRIQRLLKWTENAPERFKKMDVKPSEITVSSLDEDLITRAIKIVEDNMVDSEYTVDQLCDAMAMSRSGFYKKLSAITGMSPILFIRTLRIKRGRQLLEQSAGSISQIAYKIGLSPKQFAKYFKEEYGISPSEFKK